jgi:glycosyltransferase involved in cell wall biosynthesis
MLAKREGGKYLVSVVITTMNRSKLLREAIESVLAVQQQKFDLEIIVVDDGSTDDTPKAVKQYPVMYLRKSGLGMAEARNTGLRVAKGDFVTMLDDDDAWMPNNITPHIELFEQHPEYGAVHAQSQLVHYDKTPFGEPVPAGPLPSGWIFEALLNYFPQVGTILTRTAIAREAGDMDPTLTGDTDWDWLLRIAKRHPIGAIEQPVLLFRQRVRAEEESAWRRFPAMGRIFHRHTRSLSLLKQLKLYPILWRQRGAWASRFLMYAQMNYAKGEYKRAYRSLYYAFRCSPPHALLGCLGNWPFKGAQRSREEHGVS